MRKKKQVTIVIIPENSTRSIKKRVSYSTLYALLTVAVFLIGSFTFMVVNYSSVYYKALQAEILRRRNLKLEEQWRKIVRIEKELALLKRTDQKIRKMLGADLAPPPPKLPSSGIPAPYEGAGTPIGGMDAVTAQEETLGTNAIPLEEIPTIWPARGWLSRLFTQDHTAIDIAAPTGTPVVAPISGIVTRSGWDDRYGKIIEIENEQGFGIVYGQISRLLVKEGERVKKGGVVAFVGSTGLSSASHLHYEIRLKGRPVDPVRYLVH
ncbi:MAG: M23 family metallopeptidase [bacterium]